MLDRFQIVLYNVYSKTKQYNKLLKLERLKEDTNMKRSEMNAHQRKIFDIMDELTRDIIGGNENMLLDFSEDEEEYQNAYNFLHQGHENLANFFYDLVMGHCKAGSNAEHARFAGSQFLRDRIEVRLNKWGY